MKEFEWILLVIGSVWLVSIWLLFKVFAVFNSADGERYRKRRMQGPFVPLSTEEIEEDEQRKRQPRK